MILLRPSSLLMSGLFVISGCASDGPAPAELRPLSPAAIAPQAGAAAPIVPPAVGSVAQAGAPSAAPGLPPLAAGATANAAPVPVGAMSPGLPTSAAPSAMPVVGAAPPATGVTPQSPAVQPSASDTMAPVIPKVAGECPKFQAGTISFMGLGGIQIVAGAKQSSPTAPLIFYWHGTGSFSGEFASTAAPIQKAVTMEGGVLVSFQGSTGGDLLSGTNVFGKGDFAIVDQLVACAVRDHNIDPKRIFATGCSAGGLFATAQAAMRSSYMAAVAPNSGGFTAPVAFDTKWTPALMTIHGAAGADVVIVDFSNTSRTADDGFKKRGGFVIDCNHGGGHCAGAPLAGEIWEFFKAHPYGTSPSPWKDTLPSGFSSQCKLF